MEFVLPEQLGRIIADIMAGAAGSLIRGCPDRRIGAPTGTEIAMTVNAAARLRTAVPIRTTSRETTKRHFRQRIYPQMPRRCDLRRYDMTLAAIDDLRQWSRLYVS